MQKIIVLALILMSAFSFSQTIDEQINLLNADKITLSDSILVIENQIVDLKLKNVQIAIQKNGLPKLKADENLINHSAMSLVYSEKHEQAKWVAHIITADIIAGNVKRTNNFRVDPLVKTGSATSKDYALKYKDTITGRHKTDNFGYDRGHLAPSADFRWSKKAVSESFFYSNMSPQRPKLNRGKWAKLEGLLRAYVIQNPNTQLYVVTGPLLNDSLLVIEQSENKMSVPKFFFKVAMDLKNERAIAFIMPNKKLNYPIASYAVDINEVEEVTGINFFYQIEDGLEERLEAQNEFGVWVPEKQKGDVKPMFQPDLPKGVFNTVQAKRFMGVNKKMTIRGTVVDARKTGKGHLFFNIDQSYPNQIFTVAIWKNNILNFGYNPLTAWKGKQIAVTGKILEINGTPTMSVENESAVTLK